MAGGQSDCTAITVGNDGTVTADTPQCGTALNAVCEINLVSILSLSMNLYY